jgi:hypothetical protein
MSFQQIVWREKSKIINVAHLAILHGMLDTWKRCTQVGNMPQEPDFVAGLVLESTPILYNALSAIFGQYSINLSLTAVFCHQTPKVQFTGMRKTSCEVGDLLIAHVHTPRSGCVTRNALLYQAKISSNQPHKIGTAEIDQLRLYTDWPLFNYYHSSPLTGQRDVNPKLPHTGAQYMLIDDRPLSDPQSGLLGLPGTYPIGSCMPDQYLQNHNHLAAEFFDFLILRSGRGFADKSASSSMDGWSELVWDLLSSGFHKAFNRQNSGRFGAPRQSSGPLNLLDSSCFAQTTGGSALTTAKRILGSNHTEFLFSDTRDVPPNKDWSIDDDRNQDNGVSLILIETSEILNN